MTASGESQGFLKTEHLFPCAIRTGFTTAPADSLGLPKNCALLHLPLNDKALNVAKVTSGISHDCDSAPPLAAQGTVAWTAVYPEGSINPASKTAPKGGFGFYVAGPNGESEAFECAREVLFSYAVYFEPGFDFVQGGKLPGPYGGATPEIAYGCSGGRKEGRDQAFSLRLMWRRDGDGEIYAYLPLVQENTDVLLNVPPKSEQNPDFGFSIGRGSFKFKPGEWTVVAQRVRLNDVDQANGEIDLWANGEKVISVTGIVIRKHPDTVFRGAHFQTFFGGSSPEWASPTEQTALFANVSAGIIERW